MHDAQCVALLHRGARRTIMKAPATPLQTLISGTRRVLTLQVLLSIFAIALAGWTLAITTELLRERERLTDRVIQLEETLASRNIVVPPRQAMVEAAPAYPPEVGLAHEARDQLDARQALSDLFAPAPPLSTIVVHVRAETDIGLAVGVARSIAEAAPTQEADIRLMPARDPRAAGYYYFDGRQSGAAADFVARFNDAARRAELAPWSAQLRGTALPARGEFTAGRLDIVLPSLPPPPAETGPDLAPPPG